MSDAPSSSEGVANQLRVRVNGIEKHVGAGTTLRELIEAMGMGKQAVAAEVGGGLVPHREHAKRTLAEGDVVELVSLVGGG
jgi:thiamine biosynthesis protein ThiS